MPDAATRPAYPSDAEVEAAYRDESVSMATHAKRLGMTRAGINSRIEKLGLHGRRWFNYRVRTQA